MRNQCLKKRWREERKERREEGGEGRGRKQEGGREGRGRREGKGGGGTRREGGRDEGGGGERRDKGGEREPLSEHNSHSTPLLSPLPTVMTDIHPVTLLTFRPSYQMSYNQVSSNCI